MLSPSFAQLRHDALEHIPLHDARFERAVHVQEVVGAVRIASACLARCGRTQAFQRILPVTQSLARDANHLERVLFTIGIHSRFCDLVGELLVEVVFAGRSARSGLGHNGLFPLVILCRSRSPSTCRRHALSSAFAPVEQAARRATQHDRCRSLIVSTMKPEQCSKARRAGASGGHSRGLPDNLRLCSTPSFHTPSSTKHKRPFALPR